MTRDQIVYLCCDEGTNPTRGPSRVLGVLKTGDKNLFIHRRGGGFGNPIEMEPRCVLDFYVHESAQRRGVGAALFAFFLRAENKHPARCAYDRPSTKLLAFLRKHHGLVKYQTQTNNFVVFDAYFAVAPRPASAAREAKKVLEGRGVGLAAAARAKAAAARAAREEAERERNAKRREEVRLLAPPFFRGAPSDVGPPKRRDGIPSSETGASDGPSRESGVASSFSSSARYARPGRRFAERSDAGMAQTDYPYGSRDAAAAKGLFVSTNEDDDDDENDASRDASRRSSPRGFRTSSSGDAYRAYRSNADDDARDGESLSPKPPPRVPKPPRRATPPDVEKKNDDAKTTSDGSSSFDPPPRFRVRDASSFSAGGSRSSTSLTSSSMSDSRGGSFPSSSDTTKEERNRNPPSLRDTSYASFVRGVREMGRAARDGDEDEDASKKNTRRDVGPTNDLHATRAQQKVTATARGEYGQWVPPREGYYRARSFVKTRRAPTYHYASEAAPFLPSSAASQNARLFDQTTRFAERPIGRFPETRGGILYSERHAGVHSYGAQQDLFLRRRAAFERAEATARGDARFGDFRILPEDDDDRTTSETGFRHRASGSSASRLRRLAPLYGDGRYYGADAATRRARLADAQSAEPELVRVGRRAMGENL